MANTLPLALAPASHSGRMTAAGAAARFLLPSFSDCLLLAVLVWLFATGEGGWYGLLADGDTGWHIRTGEWILANGQVPHHDLFSFSKPGEPWFAWEWLTDVLYAVLHGSMGLKGLLILSSLTIAGFGTVLFRHLIWRGAAPFAALPLCLMVFGGSTFHFLARPHVFTMLGLAVSLWLIDADRRRPSRRVWLLVPLTLVWVNLHGGFLALIACLGLLVVGTAVEQAWAREWNLPQLRRYALLAGACAAVTFANPYGWQLHLHVASYLQSSWIKENIQEFLAPGFRTEAELQFEVMLFLALFSAAWLLRQRQVVPVLWILFWAHSALSSMRHVPLFLIVATPAIASLLTELWRAHVESAARNSLPRILADVSRDMAPACARSSIWVLAAAAALVLLPDRTMRWPADFPALKFPVAMAERYPEHLTSGRLLTQDQWADYLIYRFYPQQRVFVDGRSDFYGKELGNEYIRMTQGHWDWERLLGKHRFDRVLSPGIWPLAELLKRHPDWRLVSDGGHALLFERRAVAAPATPVPAAQAGSSGGKKAPGVI